ncbi:glycosyltransferase involved in cell wall biosynthesis [Paenibacillus cellulosilyticus]|uniref:Glycosyltransferase involved in cell wall biosynthesis n=1 Tax=Paenibacillus cellulosilyticus TaxID=375489 RepID=A0A2V2YL56_9BACL|nr:glycosyltransferase family 1 protein [Paenibacillus cellulosilyticus]PWV93816.1 glycosyltransferase involved in cell wall biosynthesis [Paenibacillus cellulosilyticus]QKS47431.1 glycosyltransferase family 4 protein [Paenibacillus cellulosilyticus]
MRHINSLFLSDHPTGLGVYSREVLNRNVDFFNDNHFNALLTNNEITVGTRMNSEQYVNRRIALNPVLRSLYLNTINSDFMYSFTHHGRTVKKKGAQIITIHDLIPLHFPNQYKGQYYYYKYLLPKTIKYSDKIITISEATKVDILNHYTVDEDKITVIHNGFEHSQAKPSEDHIASMHDHPYFLMVGTTFPHKNLDTVLRAFNMIKDQIELDCIIVGRKSPYYESLEKVIHQLGLEHRVKLLGYVNDSQLEWLYRNASVFVYPSLYEGFGLPILEAMAKEIPVLCSDTSSLPEISGGASILFNPRNETEIAERIIEICNNGVLKHEFITKGTENLRRFSWDITSEKIKDEIAAMI